jgi:hypothetical protein
MAERRAPTIRSGVVAALVIVAIALGIGLVMSLNQLTARIPSVDELAQAVEPKPFENIGPTVIRSIRALANLTTVEFVEYTVVEKGEHSGILNWATGDRLTMLAVARIGAGVDLTNLGPGAFTVEPDTGVVTVSVPEPTIQYVAVDNEATQVIDRSTGVFTQGDPRLEADARKVAEEVMVDKALETGILEQAAKNAEDVITNLLLGLGYTDVRYITEPPA